MTETEDASRRHSGLWVTRGEPVVGYDLLGGYCNGASRGDRSSDARHNAVPAPWVRLGFLAILALILGFNPSMPLPLKLVALSLVVLNLVLTLLKWRAARQRRSLPEDGDPS